LYNHAVNSNAAYTLDRELKAIRFYALEDIATGSEICINYAGEHGKQFKEWFESRNIVYQPK
jgi:SET domain-containing protein